MTTQICEAFLMQCDIGSTLFYIETGYQQQKALMTIVPYKKVPLLKQKTILFDLKAFIVASNCGK